MRDRVTWLLTRPRALWRAWKKLGLQATLQLVRIRLGAEQSTYALRIPGYRYPITIRGGQSTDTWAIYELLVMNEYALVGDLNTPRFIIDAGANIGIASLYFLHQYPSARIVAIEPDPANFEILRKNLEPYADRVTLLQGAVWKNSGRLHLESGAFEWSRSVREPNADQSGTVEAFTLPQIIARGEQNVDLLKMDIEGSESEVFGAGAQEWLPSIRNIAIEVHSKLCADRFFAAMTGYQFDQREHHKDNVIVCRNIRVAAATAPLSRAD